MARLVRHGVIRDYFKQIATEHKLIKGFATFNLNQAREQLRSGLDTPILLLESASSELDGGKTSTFNIRTISFLIMEHVPPLNFEEEDNIKERSEQYTLDILSRIQRDAQNPAHWLFGLFDKTTVVSDTPPEYLFGDMMGYNTRLELKNHEPLCFEPEKWDL